MNAQPQINQNYKLFVGADIVRTSGLVGTAASPSTLASGEIVITDPGNIILDTTSVLTAPAIKIVMGRGATEQLWQSQLFTAADLAAYVGKPFASKVQQVGYYGYNSVANTGAFDVINDNYYTVVISFYELLSEEASALMNPIVVDYLSSASATQEEIVNGLYKQLVRQLSYWAKKPILAERVSSVATGGVVTTGTLTTALGSPIVIATVPGDFTVGDYVRFGGTLSSPVYKVIAVSGTTITLDTPYQVAGSTFAIGAAEVLASAAVLAGNMGIQVTGLNQAFVLDSRPAGLVTFQLGLTNGGTTPIKSVEVSPFMGFGTYELVRTDEAASWRDQGMLYTYTEFPPTSIPTNASSTQDYSILNLGIKTPTAESQLGMGKLPANLEIACALDGNVASTFDTNYTGALDGSSCVDVLDAYVSNFTSFTAQEPNL